MQSSPVCFSPKNFGFRLQSILQILPYVTIIIVAFPILFYNILSLGSLPDLDYWNMISFNENGISFDPYYLLWVRQNEHLVFLPKLIFAVNVLVAHGNNVNLAILGWCTTVLSTMILFKLLPTHLRQHYLVASLLTIFLSAFLFNPTIVDYWLQGQTIATTATYLIFFMMFTCFYQFYLTQRWVWFNTTVGCAILLGISGSAWLPIWVSLWFGAVIWKLDKRYLLILLIAGLANYTYYIIGYPIIDGQPPMQIAPGTIVDFYITMLGVVFSENPGTARILGGFGVITSIWIVWLILRTDKLVRDQAVPWIMILLWALMFTGMVAVARSGFGIFPSRYVVFTGLAWMSVGILIIIYFSHKPKLWCYLQIPILLATLASYQILVAGWHHPNYPVFRERERLKPLAAVSLVTGVYDYNLLAKVVTVALPELLGKVANLRKYSHVPFAGEWYESCPTMGSQLNYYPTTHTTSVAGYFDNLIMRDDLLSAKVRGWAYSPRGRVACIAIVNQNQVVRGLATDGFERQDVAKALAISTRFLGWEGYTHLLKGEKLNAYAKVGEHWYLLTNTQPH